MPTPPRTGKRSWMTSRVRAALEQGLCVEVVTPERTLTFHPGGGPPPEELTPEAIADIVAHVVEQVRLAFRAGCRHYDEGGRLLRNPRAVLAVLSEGGRVTVIDPGGITSS